MNTPRTRTPRALEAIRAQTASGGRPMGDERWVPVVRTGGDLGWQAGARRGRRVHSQIMSATSRNAAEGLARELAEKLNGERPDAPGDWEEIHP